MAGTWGSLIDHFGPATADPITAIHMVHLYDTSFGEWGRILVLDYGTLPPAYATPKAALWNSDPSSTAPWNEVPNSHTNLFCCGHCQLLDSKVLTSGGGFLPAQQGEALRLAPFNLDVFDAATLQWHQGGSSPAPPPDMYSRRWYPTCTRLSSGDVYIMGGDWSLSPNTKATLCELFRSGRTWLRGFTFCESSVEYPFNYLLPTGSATVDKLFRAGPTPGTAIIDVEIADPRDPAVNGPFNAAHPEEVGATSVMWEPGKVLKFGGASASASEAVTTISRVDMTATTPIWATLLRPMNKKRMNANALQLPDRTIAVIGGNRVPPQAASVLTAEFIDPRLDGIGGEWPETAGTMAVQAGTGNGRHYHSSAILLRDSRALVAGGEDARTDAQYLEPPYFAATVWPVITEVNGGQRELAYNTEFFIDFTFDGESDPEGHIDRVVLLGLNAVTHGFDQNQRYLELEIVSRIGDDRLVVRAPVNARLAPPGWYMLFLVANTNVPSGASGVPCRNARYVKIGA